MFFQVLFSPPPPPLDQSGFSESLQLYYQLFSFNPRFPVLSSSRFSYPLSIFHSLDRLLRDLKSITRLQIALHGIPIRALKLHITRIVFNINPVTTNIQRHRSVGR